MRVAVVTPYFGEPLETLARCHASVTGQSHACRHILVADGPRQPAIDDWDCEHIPIPGPHNDIGSTPRFVGCFHAISLGYDAVAFLDADNWYGDDHVGSLVALHRLTGAGFLSSSRMLCRLDGSVMASCPFTDPDRFIDTSCMMFTRSAFPLLSWWVRMPPYAHAIGDRCMLHYVKAAGVPRAHSGEPTVFYTCGKPAVYRRLGEEPPPGIGDDPGYREAFARWVADGNPPLI